MIELANGRLKKVVILNESDQKTRIKREFFLSKRVFNQIVDEIENSDGITSFSAWVFDACRKKLSDVKAEGKKEVNER